MTGRRAWLPAAFAAVVLAAAGCGGGVIPVGDDAVDDAGGDDDDDGGAPDGAIGPDAAIEPDAIPPDALVTGVDPAIDGQLTINEFMAANVFTVLDDGGSPGDWIEIYNPTDQDLSLEGYGITDDLTTPARYILRAGVVAPAGGHLLLWLDGNPAAGIHHLDLHLSKEFGDIGLTRPDGSWIDRVHYLAQETDFSATREPDGSDGWTLEWHPSPGAANPAGAGQPMGLEVVTDPPEQVEAAADLSAPLYRNDVLPAFTLLVSPAAAASLQANPFVYVPAEIAYDGRTYGPVGVRCKGSNSFQPFSDKPSLRIKIDFANEDARFFGLKDLTFNNMDNDPSMMHERLAYFVSRSVGVPSSRANHMLLTVNDEFYGLYMNIETVKKKMLARWYPDNEGSLFEATDVDFVASYVPQYALESGPDDRSLIAGVASALTLTDADAAIAAAGTYANMTQFRRYWAMTSVIGQFDSFPFSNPGDDYFVYANPTTQRLEFLPWGMDETFFASDFNVNWTSSVLAARCKESAACWQAYVNDTWAVQAETEAFDLAGERDRVAAQIAPFVVQDLNKPYTTDEVMTSQQSLYWFIHNRRANLAGYLPPAQ